MLPDRLSEITEIPDEMVDMVVTSVENTFASICGDTPDLVEQFKDLAPLNGIIGNIAVFNPLHTLSIMLAVPKETAMAISVKFVGMEIPFESDDIGDLIGEISNILAGEVAANVETIGFRGQSSLPTATRGSDLRLFLPNKPPSARLRFKGEDGEFWLFLALYESRRH
jgi:chemotaxis protein CheX